METNIYRDIQNERDRQNKKWGGPYEDDKHTIDHWYSTISDYNGWARRMAAMKSNEKARRRYIQVAALAIAAVESMERLAFIKMQMEKQNGN